MNFQDIIQAGGIGVAVFSIWVLWKIVNNHEKHFIQTLNQNSEAIRKQAVSNQRLCDAIQRLSDTINNYFDKKI